MHKYSAHFASVFLSLFVIIFAVGCSSSKINMSQKSVTGQIQMVENEPFEKLAVRNKEGLFLLDCKGAVRDTIYNNQGRTAKIYFSKISTNKMNQKVLTVEKVELIPAGSD